MKTEEPIISGKRFKSINHKGKKSLIEVVKYIFEGNTYYIIDIKRVIKKEDKDIYYDFSIVRESENYCLIENSLSFTEDTMATIIYAVVMLK